MHANQPGYSPSTVGFESLDPARHLGNSELAAFGQLEASYSAFVSSFQCMAGGKPTLKHTDGPALSC